MEIVYSRSEHEYLKTGEVIGFYGDLLDLVRYGVDVEGIVYDDTWTVKRFLNGHRFGLNSRIESIFNYLELDMKLLYRKINELSKSDFKFILLAYLLISATVFSNTLPSLAASTYVDSTGSHEHHDTTEDSTQNTSVYAEIGSEFKVTIPKSPPTELLLESSEYLNAIL